MTGALTFGHSVSVSTRSPKERFNGRFNRRVQLQKHWNRAQQDRRRSDPVNLDLQGSGTGFPVVLGSLIFTIPLAEAGANSGSCSWVGRAVLEDGSFVAGLAEGTWERIGDELRGNVSLMHEVSDGRKIRTEGVLDHTARTFVGQMYAVD